MTKIRFAAAALTVGLAGVALSAQGVVSPVGYDVREGTTSNTFPWNNASFHYMQIHGDLRGTPRTINNLAFRRDGTSTSTVGVARTITLEMFMGDANLTGATGTFANNWVGTPTRVVASRPVNAPDWTQQGRTVPAPFDFPIVLDTPFNYTGTSDLGWEVLVTANTAPASYFADAHSGTGTGTQQGNYVMNGTGCTTVNGEINLRSNFTTTATTMSLSWLLRQAPASAPAGVLVGASDPNVVVPGLCGDGKLRTDASVLTFSGTTSSTGAYTTPVASVPYNAAFVGIALYAQGAAADATQVTLPLAATNGLVSTVPDRPTAVQGARIYLSGSTGPTGTLATNYLLVTRFQ